MKVKQLFIKKYKIPRYIFKRRKRTSSNEYYVVEEHPNFFDDKDFVYVFYEISNKLNYIVASKEEYEQIKFYNDNLNKTIRAF